MTQGGKTDSEDWLFGILHEVASRKGVAPTALPPVRDSVDPAALIDLVESSNESIKVQFSHMSFDIEVTGDGSTTVVETE